MRRHLAVWGSVLFVTVAAMAACGSVGRPSGSRATTSLAAAGTTSTARVEDIDMTAADFRNIHSWTKVRGFYVGNLLGHLQEALAVARDPNGGRYPVGTIIQLVPTEAMVKRRAGWNPRTHDWEFFALPVSKSGTRILTRGADKTVNFLGLNCASCHEAARPQFDLVCEHDHGCAPLPLTDAVIAQIQAGDPRPLH